MKNALQENFFLNFFLVSIFLIEIQFPTESINIGNLFIVFSSILLCLSTYFQNFGVLRPRFDFFKGFLFFGFAYAIFSMSSFLWSLSPLDSFVQGIYALCILVGCISVGRYDLNYVYGFIIKLFFVLSLVSLLSPIISTQYAFQPLSSTGFPELRGVFKHQQRLGLNAAVVLGIFILVLKNGDLNKVLVGKWFKYRWIMLLTIFIVFLAAQARLFSVFFFVAMLFCIFYRSNPKTIFSLLFLTVAILVSYFEYVDVFLRYYDNDEMTLSGRTTVWTRSYLTALDEPIFGYGFATFDTEYFDYLWFDYRPAHAHNSFLQVFFDLGVVGFALFILMTISHIRVGSLYSVTFQSYSISLFAVVFSILCGLTGIVYGGKPSTLMTITIMLLVIENKQYLTRRL
jgi:exopolysaccharide production protein ExoQ